MKDEKMNKVTPDVPAEAEEVPMKEEYYPSFRLKLQDLPEARDWKIGDTKLLLVGVKMNSITETRYFGEVCFEIVKVKPVDKKKKNK